MNRKERRSVTHDLRRHEGCTCTPIIADHPRDLWPPGATFGADIRHQPGCELGDQIVALNRLGIIPSLIVTGTRCAR